MPDQLFVSDLRAPGRSPLTARFITTAQVFANILFYIFKKKNAGPGRAQLNMRKIKGLFSDISVVSPLPHRRKKTTRTACWRHAGWNWRRGPESNRCTRICSPLRSHSATAPALGRKPLTEPRLKRSPADIDARCMRVKRMVSSTVARRLGRQ